MQGHEETCSNMQGHSGERMDMGGMQGIKGNTVENRGIHGNIGEYTRGYSHQLTFRQSLRDVGIHTMLHLIPETKNLEKL